jgi:alkylation response protein AidB-like acyl-CoA dehydrogenase
MTPMGPELRVMHFKRPDVELIETWDVMGLSGTGSNDFVVNDVFVPETHSWVVRPGNPRGSHFQSPLYRFPFMGIFAFAMGAVALGIGQGAIDTAVTVAKSKVPVRSEVTLRERPLFQHQVADAIATVSSGRAWLHQVVAEIWQAVQAGHDVPVEARAQLLLAASHATRSGAQAVDLAYTASGGSANYRSSPLQRAFRDVHAVTQHVATAPQSVQSAGRMLVGLPPDNPLLLL